MDKERKENMMKVIIILLSLFLIFSIVNNIAYKVAMKNNMENYDLKCYEGYEKKCYKENNFVVECDEGQIAYCFEENRPFMVCEEDESVFCLKKGFNYEIQVGEDLYNYVVEKP